jgi:CubicO group peptidase (beta-lactamase class C family)
LPVPDGLTVMDPPNGTWSHPVPFCDAASGLVSTVDDLLAFARMILRGGAPLLPEESIRAMTTDQLTPDQKVHGGLTRTQFNDRSWGYLTTLLHTGAFKQDGGFGVSWLVDPRYDLTVIVLTQRLYDSPSVPEPHNRIREAAYAALV